MELNIRNFQVYDQNILNIYYQNSQFFDNNTYLNF